MADLSPLALLAAPKRERSVSTLLLNRVCHCYTGHVVPIVWKPFDVLMPKIVANNSALM